jgi:hypothetical protein
VSHNAGAVNAQDIVFRLRKDLMSNRKPQAKPAAPASSIVAPQAPSIAAAPAQVAAKPAPASVSAQVNVAPAVKSATVSRFGQLTRAYALATAVLTAVGIFGIFQANRIYATDMYDERGMEPAAEAFAEGKNYANFDLNINIRKLRDYHIGKMTETPNLVLLGASHWQEAHGFLLKDRTWYNSHIHREFWEDLLAMVHMWEKHDRLPKTMIIALRDNIFMPVEERTDFLWLPGIEYYREMADKLGIEKQSWFRTAPYQRGRERLSLSMLFNNVTRWYNAEELPHKTSKDDFQSLDVLLPDGSIKWSRDHMNIFTPERTLYESETFADLKRKRPPKIDPRAEPAVDKLLAHLQSKGVKVYFARPPYNPQFWDRVTAPEADGSESPYVKGLKPVIELQERLAAKYGIPFIGSYDPKDVGCVPSQYIDSEHANPECLQNIFDEFLEVEKKSVVK